MQSCSNDGCYRFEELKKYQPSDCTGDRSLAPTLRAPIASATSPGACCAPAVSNARLPGRPTPRPVPVARPVALRRARATGPGISPVDSGASCANEKGNP